MKKARRRGRVIHRRPRRLFHRPPQRHRAATLSRAARWFAFAGGRRRV